MTMSKGQSLFASMHAEAIRSIEAIDMVTRRRELRAGKLVAVGEGSSNGTPYLALLGLGATLGKPDIMLTGIYPWPLDCLLSLTWWLGRLDYEGRNVRIPVAGDGMAVLGARDLAEAVPRAIECYDGESFRLVQCFFADSEGRFPWEAGAKDIYNQYVWRK